MAIKTVDFKNIRSHFGHFRRLLIAVVALALIVGLVAAVYWYGKDNQQKTSNSTSRQSTLSANELSQRAAESAQSDRAKPQASGSSKPVGVRVTPSDNLTASGPSTTPRLANTGPADYAAPIFSFLVILFISYRKSRAALYQTWRQI